MRFESPKILWLLAIVPPLVWFLVLAWRKKKELMETFVSPSLLSLLTQSVSFKMQKYRLAILVVALIFLILSAAQPQWGFKWEEVRQRGLDIIVAIDTSRSMLAEDIKPNRLTRAKLAALDLMAISKSDRLGLVTFAGTAFLQCPLTLDEGAFRQSIDIIDVDIMPQGGTAIAEAIEASIGAFKDSSENYRVVVIFSDGEDLEEGALEAAEKAAEKGIRIFTVGVGTPEGEILRIPTQGGRYETVKDEHGNPVRTRLNAQLLQQIAAKTGGFYLQLTGTRTVETIYERGIATLPKAEHSSRLVKRYYERFYIPLTIALLLLIIEIFIPERKLQNKPISIYSKLGALTIAFALLNGTTNLEAASLSSAFKAYKEGKYKTALQEFKELLKKNPDKPQLQYNAGVAAYQAGRYDEAAVHFLQAMNDPKDLSLQQKAYYNWGNSLYKIGEQEEDLSKKLENWKQAVNGYESALKLDPKDSDSKYNLEFVKKKIEELMKQQPKQNQSQQDKNKQQQDKDKQQQDKQQQNKQQDKQNKQDQQKDQQQNPQQQQNQQQEASANKDNQKQQQQGGQQEMVNQDKNTGKTNAQSMAGQVFYMTPEQAMQLLEAQKNEDRILLFQPPDVKPKHSDRYIRNW